MRMPVTNRKSAYLVAAMAVAAATMVRMLFDAWFEDRFLFAVYYVAVALAAWYGGLWPGIFAAVASYLVADYLFIAPRYVWNLTDWDRESFNRLLSFVAATGTIIALNEVLARANQRYRDEARTARNNIGCWRLRWPASATR